MNHGRDRKWVIVLDTSAFESGIPGTGGVPLFTTGSVVREIGRRKPRLMALIEEFISSGALKVRDPQRGSVNRIIKSAEDSGDAPRLSPTDIDVLALTYELSEEGLSASLLTNDISMQNTAHVAGLNATGSFAKAKTYITWMYYCPACHHRFQRPPPDMVCPYCGARIKRKPIERRKSS